MPPRAAGHRRRGKRLQERPDAPRRLARARQLRSIRAVAIECGRKPREPWHSTLSARGAYRSRGHRDFITDHSNAFALQPLIRSGAAARLSIGGASSGLGARKISLQTCVHTSRDGCAWPKRLAGRQGDGVQAFRISAVLCCVLPSTADSAS